MNLKLFRKLKIQNLKKFKKKQIFFRMKYNKKYHKKILFMKYKYLIINLLKIILKIKIQKPPSKNQKNKLIQVQINIVIQNWINIIMNLHKKVRKNNQLN